MDPQKTNAQLLRDLFNLYKAMFENKTYEAYENSADKSICLNLSNKKAHLFGIPTLVLKQWGDDVNNLELILLSSEPEEGLNKNFPPKLFSLYSQNVTGNILCGSPDRTMGGISNLMIFKKDSITYNKLIIDLITKANNLVETND
jgi:hypothetical protein